MQTITYQEVLVAGRKAYEEKRLSAQGPTPKCAYSDLSGRPCVIGSALNEETIGRILHIGLTEAPMSTLLSCKLIAINEDEYDHLVTLQDLHDRWATPDDETKPVDLEKNFVKVLYAE